jgi:hypothetical protein
MRTQIRPTGQAKFRVAALFAAGRDRRSRTQRSEYSVLFQSPGLLAMFYPPKNRYKIGYDFFLH